MSCFQDSPCIVWGFDLASGTPFAQPFISVFPENDIDCTDEGLFVPTNLQVVNCAAFPPFAASGVPVGLLQTVAESGSVVLTNPTDDRVMNVVASVAFGAVRLVCTQQVAPGVTDFLQFGAAGTLPPFIPADRVGDYGIEDGNLTDPAAKTVITIPGRHRTLVLCPSLPPGASAEVKYQRTYSTAGLVGGLADFLLQPTIINLWGIVV